MVKIDQIETFKYAKPTGKYLGPTWYMEHEIPAWSHPATIALGMLNRLYHRRFQGAMIIGTMGDGKTALAQCIAHQIHKHASNGIKIKVPTEKAVKLNSLKYKREQKPQYCTADDLAQIAELEGSDLPDIEEKTVRWDFKVVWAGAHEFTHQEEFYQTLPKFPTIVIYDDISGALKQIGEKQMEANFSTLSEIRWKLDPQTGLIPCIVIVNYHYSKNLEKEFRSVLGMDTIFTEISNEERSNIDSIAPPGTLAHSMMESFDQISQPMINEHAFKLRLGNGKEIQYFTDNPFRCACAITKNDGKLILFSNKDTCDICIKKKRKFATSAEVIYNEMMGLGYSSYAKKAMIHCLERRGYEVEHPYFRYSVNHFETKIIPRYEFDMQELKKYILAQDHKSKLPLKKNKKLAKEKEGIEYIETNSKLIEEESKEEADKPESENPN